MHVDRNIFLHYHSFSFLFPSTSNLHHPTIEKVAKGSYLQGNERFGDTAGVQYACNSLFALFCFQIRQGFVWKKTDLDHVIVQGDLLHKSLNTYGMLSLHELPRLISSIQIEYLQLETNI